jgi:hypothetical protein
MKLSSGKLYHLATSGQACGALIFFLEPKGGGGKQRWPLANTVLATKWAGIWPKLSAIRGLLYLFLSMNTVIPANCEIQRLNLRKLASTL